MNGDVMQSAGTAAVARQEPRIQGVKFLNAWPALYGLMLGRESERVRMAVPALLTQRLLGGEVDVALAPVATLGLSPRFEVVRGICIGADGPVASVLVVGEASLQDMSLLLLDNASRTSVVLAQLVAAHLRGGRPLAVAPADHGRMAREVGGRVGAVIIGDHALALRGRYPYELDLAEAWRQWTGLPFVFAAWIARQGVADRALADMLRSSLAFGLSARREIAHMWAAQEGGDPDFYEHYLTTHVRYALDERFAAGLYEFLQRAAAAGFWPAPSLRLTAE